MLNASKSDVRYAGTTIALELQLIEVLFGIRDVRWHV